MEQGRTPDPTRRSQQARQAVLEAASQLLDECGYARLTIEAVATRAGVGKQTIYRWWPSKGAVVLEAVQERLGSADDMAFPDTGDIESDLRAVLRATVAELADPGLSATSRALTVETLNDQQLGKEMVASVLQPQLDAVKERLRAGQRAGQLRADLDLDVAVELLFGPMYHRWLLGTGPLTEEYADALTDLAIAALRAARPIREREG